MGYDPSHGTVFVEVPRTPMVAVVVSEVVATFLSRESADAKVALHGFGPKECTISPTALRGPNVNPRARKLWRPQ